MFVNTIIAIFVMCFCLESIFSVTIVPERTTVVYVNEKYISNVTFNVRKTGKRGGYVLNLMGESKVQCGNNVTFHAVVFEHRMKYNQYIRSFIEFHLKVCDLIHKDKLFGAALRRLGVTQCPIPPGPISWTNFSLPTSYDFEIPFERAKAELKLKSESANELMMTAEIFMHLQKRRP